LRNWELSKYFKTLINSHKLGKLDETTTTTTELTVDFAMG
jgi:hypothetical protein